MTGHGKSIVLKRVTRQHLSGVHPLLVGQQTASESKLTSRPRNEGSTDMLFSFIAEVHRRSERQRIDRTNSECYPQKVNRC